MADAHSSGASPRLTLFADAALFTAGAWAVTMGVVAAVVFIAGGAWDWMDASMWCLLAGLIAGPLSAWLLHGRRMSWAATGVVIGYLVGVAVMTVVFMLFGAVTDAGRSAGLFPVQGQQAEETLGLVLLIEFLAAFLVVSAWLDVGAARDLTAHPRARLRLDLARVVSSVAFVVYCVMLLIQAFSEQGVAVMPNEARITGPQSMLPLLVLLFAAIWGVIATAGADLLARRAERRAGQRVERQVVSGA